MGDVKSIIPDWTADDFTSIGSSLPYEWLYEKRDDKFLFMQYRSAIREMALRVGVKDFIGRYKAYEQSRAIKSGQRIDNVTQFDGQPIQLACGEYTCDDLGIFVNNKFGEEIQVCDHPIMPVKRLVNIDSNEVKLEIAFRRRGRWVRMIFDKTILASNQKILELAKYGVGVDSENAREMVRYLSAMENLNYDEIEETRSVGRLGWISDGEFSPYVEKVMFDGDICFHNMFKAVREFGSYEKWLECAREIREGGTVARIMLAASFASALIHPLGGLPFFVHVWGGTEAGKTVGLMVAASVWANPAMGEYISTFNSTSVGLEMRAGFVNSLPLCVDELQVIRDKRNFDSTIYLLAEGIGRSRGARAGGLQRMQTWKNCIITTGEMPIDTGSSGGGAINRIIDVDCRDEKLFPDPHAVVACVAQNYGHAGRRFIDGLLPFVDVAKKTQREFYSKLIERDATEKQALATSMLLAADAISDALIFGDGNVLTVDDMIPYLANKNEVSANERALDWLFDFVAANPGKFNPESPEIWGAVDDKYIYFIRSIFDEKMNEAGFNPQSFLSWAARSGKIERGEKLTKKKRLKGFSNSVRCVWIVVQDSFEDVPSDKIPF